MTDVTHYNFQRLQSYRGKPPVHWMLHGVLPLEGLAALYGPSGSGKSFLALDLAVAIAEGRQWFGLYVEKRPVTYVCLEGERGMGSRVDAWCTHHGRDMPDNLLALADCQPFSLRDAQNVEDLLRGIREKGNENGLLIIDTLNQASPGTDENASSDMGRVIAATKRVQARLGGLVLLVHHTGKDASKGLRGHSSLLAALDVAIEVVKLEAQYKWVVAKSKDGITGTALFFDLQVMETGEYSYGPKVTSCVVVPGTVAASVKKVRPPQGINQEAVAAALLPAFATASLMTDEEGVMHRCLRWRLAVAAAALGLPEGTEAAKRRNVARSTLIALVDRGYYARKMIEEEDWLWKM